MNKQKYKAEATGIETTLNIGKSGIESVVEELKKQLKLKKIVKVKILKTALLEKNKQELSICVRLRGIMLNLQ